ncbi:MAG: hypothetical protein U9P81_04535, partial [Euryarchaeota archaeon]|nr:hypothetical protein [Euryarchaeota archaeon]
MNISINPKTGIIVISFFIMILSLTLLIHSPGVLAQDLNNTSFDSNESKTILFFNITSSQEEMVVGDPVERSNETASWTIPELFNQSFEAKAVTCSGSSNMIQMTYYGSTQA